MIYTFDFLDDLAIETINEYFKFCSFVDGSLSGSKDKTRKWNEEIFDTLHGQALIDYTDKIIKNAEQFTYTILPRATTVPKFVRYKEGMHYAYHNDFYLHNQVRTDYSVTIALNDPSEYEGGELVFKIGDNEITNKLPAGKGIVYPTGTLHKVNEVTSGERRVIIFWVESVIQDSRIREVLAEYSDTLMRMGSYARPWMGELEKTRYRLIREYAQF